MNTKLKIALIIGGVILLSGILLIGIAILFNGFDFTSIGGKYETNIYKIEETFDSITIDTKISDITFVYTEGEPKIEFYEKERLKHSAKIEAGELRISSQDERRWFDFISLGFQSPRVTLYLNSKAFSELHILNDTGDLSIPQGFIFNEVNISTHTGDTFIRADIKESLSITATTGKTDVEGINAKDIYLKASTGDIKLNGNGAETVYIETSTGNIQTSGERTAKKITLIADTGDIRVSDTVCDKISVEVTTGDITFKNSLANELFESESSTGNVTIEESDAGRLEIKTSTGRVKGHLLTDKIFVTSTSTGKVRVPSSERGGICKVTTSTGDILFD